MNMDDIETKIKSLEDKKKKILFLFQIDMKRLKTLI